MNKTIIDCQWFGTSEPLTIKQLEGCGCDRCLDEIVQKQYLDYIFTEYRKESDRHA